MNTPSPLIPQGTLPAKGKSSFFFKVVMILAVHVVLIGGMLLQGCKDTNKDNASNPPAPDTNTASTDTSNLPPVASPGMSNAETTSSNPGPVSPGMPPVPPGPQSNMATQPPPIAPVQPPVAIPAAPTTADTKEYVIASGDTLGKLAHRNGVSLKAIIDANPGINPKKLKVGQKVEIPVSAGSVASAGGAAPDMGDTGDTATYTVKSGDTLSRIAKAHHTSYKKIMAMNDLKTTSIKVGEKLKLPSSAPAEAPAAPATSAVAPMQAAPAAPNTAAATPTTAAN